jgi:tetratricopeptide (TPR) repeat protein
MAHLAMVATWVLIVIGAIWLVILPGAGGYFGITSVWIRLPSTVALAVGLGTWLLLAIRLPFWRPQSSLSPGFIASIAAIALSLAFSVRPTLGAEYLAYAILLTGAYLLLVRLFAHAYFGPRLGGLAVLLCLGLCIWYIPRVVAQWAEFWTDVGRITTPPLRPEGEALAYGNPGTLATVVILLWLASLAHLGFASRRARFMVVGLTIPVVFVILVTAARGAWVGLAVAMAATSVVWLLDAGHRRAVAELVSYRRVRIVGTGVVAAGFLVVATLMPAIVQRLGAGAAEVRSVFNATALRMLEDAPISGLGPGMWPVERARYTLAGESDYYIPHAHNLYLQTLAELGIVGAFVGLFVIGLVGWLITRGIRSGDPLARRLGWTSLIGLVYLGTHQLFDFYANLPSVAFAFALSLGRLDALQQPLPWWRGDDEASVPSRFGMVLLAIAIIPVSLWLVRTELAAADGQRATDSANHGDWDAALETAQSANEAAPGTPPYLFTLGLAEAHEGHSEEAITALRDAAAIDDYPMTWLNLAALQLDAGRESEARASLERAMRLGAQNPQVAIAAMSLYLRLRDEEAATTAAMAGLRVAPTLASDSYWSLSPERARIRDRAIDQIIDADGTHALQVSIESERISDARRLVEAMAEPSRTRARTVLEAWLGDRTAFESVRAEALRNPLDPVLTETCHRLAVHARERIDGQDWECRGVAGPGAPVVRVGDLPGGRSQLPGPNWPWHFQYVYRRLAPYDELVPGLPHVIRLDLM